MLKESISHKKNFTQDHSNYAHSKKNQFLTRDVMTDDDHLHLNFYSFLWAC